MQQIRKRKRIIKNSGAFVLGCLRLYHVRFQLQIYQAIIIIIIIIIIINLMIFTQWDEFY